MRTGLRRAALDALMDLSDVVLMTLVREGSTWVLWWGSADVTMIVWARVQLQT
jgi:hypothetical protein